MAKIILFIKVFFCDTLIYRKVCRNSIKRGGKYMPDIISNIVYAFAVQVRKLLGDKLSKIILYGSYARGDYRENSDVDVMILVKNMNEEDIRIAEEKICDMAFDIELERGVHISAILKDESQFEDWEETLPFYYNVRREGVEIGAE